MMVLLFYPRLMYSAGVLPFAIVGAHVYLLLGRDRKDQCLSDFGGRREVMDRYDPAYTAAREFFEESAGSVLSLERTFAKLQTTACRRLTSSTIGGSPYYMFIVNIPWDPTYIICFEKIKRLLRDIKPHHRYLEKSELCWVASKDLLERTDLRSVFQRTVKYHWTQIQEYITGVSKNTLHNYMPTHVDYPTPTANKAHNEIFDLSLGEAVTLDGDTGYEICGTRVLGSTNGVSLINTVTGHITRIIGSDAVNSRVRKV